MSSHSPSVILAWSVAAAEARAVQAHEIEPAHLLIGVCKLCDPELGRRMAPSDEALQTGFAHEGERLRTAFASIGLDPTILRRRVRATLTRGDHPQTDMTE